MNTAFTRILQITDLHLYANHTKRLLNVNTWDSFRAVLLDVKRQCELHPPQLIVLTGDLCQDAALEAYEALVQEFKLFKCPIAWIAGNHDDLALMKQGLIGEPLTAEKEFQFDNWEIVLLNSAWPEHVEGKITDEALRTLETRLRQSTAKHHFLMIHHHLLDLQTTWLDKLKLSNADKLLAVIDQFPTIKVVLSGHVHQFNEQLRQGVSYLTTPSTGIQFKPHSKQFMPDSQYPGYRWFNLLPDGSFRTEIRRVKPPEWLPDLKSGGY
ncbi:MAG: 3',5'-cyclic-AMP phosphodiesterase [Gammaproteobacteria bacterium]